MLSRESRLRRTRDIERVRSVGRSVGTRALHVRFAPNGQARSRATVVVSQRTAKSAVARNRIKRQVRAVLKPLLVRLTPPMDLVIIVHRSAMTLPFATLREVLVGALDSIASRSKKR